jgi:hypothetical protein
VKIMSHARSPGAASRLARRGLAGQRICRTLLLLAAVVLVCSHSAAGEPITIDTTGPDGPGPEGVGSFGEPGAATVGQTFVAPAGALQLDRFTFFLEFTGAAGVRNPPGGPARFAGYVSAWDGEKATGPLLFASGETQLTTPDVLTPVTFDTGIRVTPGGTYVAFLSASGFFDGLEDNTGLRVEGDPYAGGGHVALNNGNDFSQIFTTRWGGLAPRDLAFRAEFTPVPEPSTMLLVGTAVAAGAARRRRRKRLARVGSSER